MRCSGGALHQAGAPAGELVVERLALQMGPTDGHAHLSRGHGLSRLKRYRRMAGGAQRGRLTLKRPLPALRQVQQRLVLVGLGDKGHTARQAIGTKSGGHGNGRIVQQVHKVGVITKVAVARDGLGQQRGDGVNGG